MDASEIKTLIQNEFNGWPILNQTQDSKNLKYKPDDLTHLLLNLHFYNANPIFVFRTSPLDNQMGIGAIVVYLCLVFIEVFFIENNIFLKVDMAEKETYLNLKNKSTTNEYKRFIVKIVQLFNPSINANSIKNEVDEIYDFENKLEQVLFNEFLIENKSKF